MAERRKRPTVVKVRALVRIDSDGEWIVVGSNQLVDKGTIGWANEEWATDPDRAEADFWIEVDVPVPSGRRKLAAAVVGGARG